MATIQNSTIYTRDIVVQNLYELNKFQVGDLPVCDPNTGKITKEYSEEERSGWITGPLVTLKRASGWGLHLEVFTNTFEKAIQMIKEQYNTSNLHGKNWKKLILEEEHLGKLFLNAIHGLQRIEQTYRDQKKMQTVDKIQEIYKEYQQKFTSHTKSLENKKLQLFTEEEFQFKRQREREERENKLKLKREKEIELDWEREREKSENRQTHHASEIEYRLIRSMDEEDGELEQEPNSTFCLSLKDIFLRVFEAFF